LLDRPARLFWLLTTGAILAAIVVTIRWVGPLPPRVILMTTGPAGSNYEAVGRRYQEILKRSGVSLKLVPSAGGVENLRLLNDPHSGVSVGLAQGGLTDQKQSPELESLGTIFYEPLWFFYRGLLAANRADNFLRKKVSIGPEGGGTRVLASQFLTLNAIDTQSMDLLAMPPADAAAALMRGEIDGAAMVTAWDSDVVKRLLASPEINIASFPRADAYVALFPYLSKLVLPAGVGSLANNRPPTDVNLVAPKASLIVRGNLHPAIQYLLLEAAAEIHSAPRLFQKSGQFPAAEQIDLPLSRHAQQFYKSGAPFLQRYLPFWLAVLASELLVLLIPVLGVAYPLLRLLPALYGWVVRRRIARLYGELKIVELELESPRCDRSRLSEQLEQLDKRAGHLRVPNAFANLLYQLRSHIGLVRSRLAAVPDSTGEPHGAGVSAGARGA
jgi:TRAP-type uncharacterized transport system substrate-binding protein